MSDWTIQSRDESEQSELLRAIRRSFSIGCGLLVWKLGAAWWTGSVALFSDAAESVVHVLAVGFAWFSVKLSVKPADDDHPYGHAKVGFLSSAVEGAMIGVAAVLVIHQAASDLLFEPRLSRPLDGLFLTLVVVVVNGALGWYLVRLGRSRGSLIIEANGQHVLTDCYTSLAVAAGLGLAVATGWRAWDPICAAIVALNMGYSAFRLISRSVHGLMDRADPALHARLDEVLLDETRSVGIQYHALRHRDLGEGLWVDVHLLFPGATPVAEAHRVATSIELALFEAMGGKGHVTTHLEALEDHDEIHGSTDPSHSS